jgi:hypothetical protein
MAIAGACTKADSLRFTPERHRRAGACGPREVMSGTGGCAPDSNCGHLPRRRPGAARQLSESSHDTVATDTAVATATETAIHDSWATMRATENRAQPRPSQKPDSLRSIRGATRHRTPGLRRASPDRTERDLVAREDGTWAHAPRAEIAPPCFVRLSPYARRYPAWQADSNGHAYQQFDSSDVPLAPLLRAASESTCENDVHGATNRYAGRVSSHTHTIRLYVRLLTSGQNNDGGGA